MILLSRSIVYLKLLGLTIIMLCIAGCAAKKSISIDKEEPVVMEEEEVAVMIEKEVAVMIERAIEEAAVMIERASKELAVMKKARLRKGEIPPRFHVWDMLVQDGDETLKYGMYTYVLFGRRVKSLSEQDSEISLRYEYLLNAIIGSTDAVGEAKTNRAESNIFYIPSKKIFWDGTFRLADYDSSLARIYISRLSVMIKEDNEFIGRFTTKPGPFLVSTLYPLGRITQGNFPLLYADLSEANPAAITEIVQAYKSHISHGTVDGIERFNPLRLMLLNWFLNFDDDLKIVRMAAADWLPMSP